MLNNAQIFSPFFNKFVKELRVRNVLREIFIIKDDFIVCWIRLKPN